MLKAGCYGTRKGDKQRRIEKLVMDSYLRFQPSEVKLNVCDLILLGYSLPVLCVHPNFPIQLHRHKLASRTARDPEAGHHIARLFSGKAKLSAWDNVA